MQTLFRQACLALCLLLCGGLLMNTANAAETGSRAQNAAKNMQGIFAEPDRLAASDPELVAIKERLLYGEIAERGTLSASKRALVTLVTLTAVQADDELLARYTKAALAAGAKPVEVREALYQCVPYIGFARVEAALVAANKVFTEQGIALPLADQGTVSEKSRFADGLAVQKKTFGDAIDKMHATAPEDQKDIVVNYLSAFCFGDFFTRSGLDPRTRELLIFAAISSIGGCEPQVKSHVQGNLSVGNTRQDLLDALAQMMPWLGFPRTLNALACINAVVPAKQAD